MWLEIKFHRRAIYRAVEKKNKDIVQLLLSHPDIDVNHLDILYH